MVNVHICTESGIRLILLSNIEKHELAYKVLISWREARSSIRRLVTGSGAGAKY